MTHEHNWIDITAIGDAFETRKCFECGREQRSDISGGSMTDWDGLSEAQQREIRKQRALARCVDCGALKADHEPSGCCGDGGGSTYDGAAV